MTDNAIIRLFFSRNENALKEAEAKYGAYCRAAAKNILGSTEDAEECFSDALLRAWNAIPPLEPNDLRSFLLKTTRNLAFDRYRAKYADKRGSGEICAVLEELAECVGGGSAEDAVLAGELSEAVNRFLRELPHREAGIFLRRYFFAEDTGKIARRFGITASHTAVLLSRTRQKLRQHLRKEGWIP